MKVNKEKMFEILEKYCNGNYNRFAREMGIDPSHLYRFLNKGIGGGSKLIGGFIKFCKTNDIDFEEYIEY